MPTNFPHRLLLIVPAVRVTALQAWFTNNLGPEWANTFTNGLVPAALPASTPVATHYWTSFACTDAQAKSLLSQIASIASVAAPAGWSSLTRQQKVDWLNSVQAAVYASTGVYVTLCFNDSDWLSPDTALAACSLQRQILSPTP